MARCRKIRGLPSLAAPHFARKTEPPFAKPSAPHLSCPPIMVPPDRIDFAQPDPAKH